MRRVRGTAALSVVTAGLCLTCAPAWAGIFSSKQPVPQWGLDAARTKTPEYAKDSPAVVLYDEYVETIDANGRSVERERDAIRVLKPQGRRYASCGVSYDVDEKINYLRVWTIAADEKQYQAQDTDFIEEGADTGVPVMLMTEKRRVAHPPAVDVGAIVVCESEELLAPYQHENVWDFQSSIPIVFQALEVDLPPGRKYSAAWHRHDPVKPAELTPNHWRWELHDIPALDLRDIPSAPAWRSLAAHMTVQWDDAAVEGKENQWRAIGEYVTKLQANRPDPSPEITAKVQSLLVGAPDFYTKLSRITESIQKDIRYFVVERGIGGWQAHPAADIFRNRYGDCKDKTTLLISMLRVAGIKAYYMPVDSHRGVVDPDDPSMYGNHMITAIEVPADVSDARLQAVVKAKDGKRYLIFDPTDERTPVGNLPSNEQGGYGLLAAGEASEVMAIPVLMPDANGSERKGTFALAADGTLTGTVDSSHTGPEGADIRWNLKNTDEKERREHWEKVISHDVPGVALTSVRFVQAPELSKPVEFHYDLTAGQYAHHAGPLLLVRPRVLGSYVRPFDDKPRTLPVDLEATGRWRDSYDIALPDGFAVDELPDPVDIDLDFASYHSKISSKGNVIHYEREYVVRQVEIPAEKAAAFRKLEGAIIMDEKGTAVLKKVAERASRE